MYWQRHTWIHTQAHQQGRNSEESNKHNKYYLPVQDTAAGQTHSTPLDIIAHSDNPYTLAMVLQEAVKALTPSHCALHPQCTALSVAGGIHQSRPLLATTPTYVSLHLMIYHNTDEACLKLYCYQERCHHWHHAIALLIEYLSLIRTSHYSYAIMIAQQNNGSNHWKFLPYLAKVNKMDS